MSTPNPGRSPLLVAMLRCLDLLDEDERYQLVATITGRPVIRQLRQHPAGCPRDPYPHGDCSYPDHDRVTPPPPPPPDPFKPR